MKINNVIILAAGKGTRMGPIGEECPKVLWPLLNFQLLEWQVLFAKRLLPRAKIFINSFYYNKELINAFSESEILNSTELVIEDEKLDIGGGIHNIAQKIGYSGYTLVLNADQFIMFDQKYLSELEKQFDPKMTGLLITKKVDIAKGYNTFIFEENKIKEIEKYKHGMEGEGETYTGVSVICMDNLERHQGESSFFNSVANYKKDLVLFNNCDELEYWDFGTLERYIDAVKELSRSKSLFLNWIENESKAKIEKFRDTNGYKFRNFKINLNENKVSLAR